MFLLFSKGLQFEGNDFSYSGLVIIATLCYGINVNIIKYKLDHYPPIIVAAIPLAFMAIPCLFILFYLGMPIAIIIICAIFIPLYHKLQVFTAYEYLEKRFDNKTRTLGAFLFLIARSIASGLTI